MKNACRPPALAEGRQRGGGVPAPPPRADRRPERVVEVGDAPRRGDRIAAAGVRLVHEALVAAPDEREAVPLELLRPPPAVVRARELPVGVVAVGEGPPARRIPVQHQRPALQAVAPLNLRNGGREGRARPGRRVPVRTAVERRRDEEQPLAVGEVPEPERIQRPPPVQPRPRRGRRSGSGGRTGAGRGRRTRRRPGAQTGGAPGTRTPGAGSPAARRAGGSGTTSR